MVIWTLRRDNSRMIETKARNGAVEAPFHRILREQMARRGYNPHSLAIAAGLKSGAIADVFRKLTMLRGENLVKVADALKLTVKQLLGAEPIPKTPDDTQLISSEQTGKIAETNSEVAILAFWRTLDPEQRETFLANALHTALLNR